MSFEEFWLKYPRKEGKKPAIQQWAKLSTEQQAKALTAITMHIQAWEAKGTEKEFIPHARTWLYQERFEDEIELPKPKVIVPNWWASETGIMTKAKEIGLSVRPGESWFELKNRINEAVKQSDNL